eukprot:8097822-Pyramimonas_sp.AAC.1
MVVGGRGGSVEWDGVDRTGVEHEFGEPPSDRHQQDRTRDHGGRWRQGRVDHRRAVLARGGQEEGG